MKNQLLLFALALVLAASIAFAAVAPGGGGGSSYPTNCAISPSSVSVKVGEVTQFKISCADMNGNTVTCPQMQWATTIGSFSMPDGTALASQPPTPTSGVYLSSGKSIGSGTVSATAPPLSQPTFSCQSSVVVTAGNAAKVTVSPTPVTLSTGAAQQFSAQAFDQYDNPIVTATAAPQFTWSTTGGIGKVDFGTGLFSATTAGKGQVTALYSDTPSLQGIRGSADITVVSSPSTKFCTLEPSSANVMVGKTQTFSATCYSQDPRMVGPKNSEITCPAMLWSASEGKIQPNSSPAINSQSATFTAPTATSTVTITAYENSPLASPVAGMTCTAAAEIVPGSVSTVTISPSAASLLIGDVQQFSATAADSYGNPVGDAQFLWSTTGSIGAVDGGVFKATAAGTGTVRAEVNCPAASLNGCPHDTATVSVSATSSGNGTSGGTGGNGGTGNGGSSFASSSTVSYTCAGKPGTLTVQIFKSGATALAEIYYKEGLSSQNSQKILSVDATNNQAIAFTPEKAGRYELRVTVGTDQRNADFSVMACTPFNENTPKNVSIQLQQPNTITNPPKPTTQVTPATTVAPPSTQQPSGIPVYLLVIGAV
ncbi:MAG: Ig-like domain-containing protein, partial [Candidatus Micrarchaeota archaeon]|nr:Ig-like domain-containing protein [Candidatus Micrarchaeota archaeon]